MTKRRDLNNIVVVGGGTAGWLSALYIKKVLPDSSVTVVESEDIGILGAGEGTTPHMIGLLDFLEIPVSKIVKEASATIKNGIKFTNWRNNGEYYYHAFELSEQLGFGGCNINKRYYLSSDAAAVLALSKEDSLNSVDFIAKISEKNKVPFIFNMNNSSDLDPIFQFDGLAYFSLHFNAAKLAECLKNIAISRGVIRVEGIVDSFEEDEYGDIVKVKTKDMHLNSDFIFDCSGFSRLIVGKHYKSKWKSHTDILPVDTAVPFFIPIKDNDISSYTESIAMKYGWMWKIPTQDRYGCGYVFDSSLITEEEAVKEIEEYLGFEPEYPRKNKGGFKFKAGYFEEPWKNNCVAVGLSSGFIEPLEATSIWVSIESLRLVLSNPEILTYRNDFHSNEFNKRFKKINDSVVDFVYLHYLSDRDDTDFWKKFKDIEKAPEKIKNLITSWENRLPQSEDHTDSSQWAMYSWVAVAAGIGRLDKKLAEEAIALNKSILLSKSIYDQYQLNQSKYSSSCMDHFDFLTELKRSN
jgi:tryptophan halogenase